MDFFCKNNISPNAITVLAYPLLYFLYQSMMKKQIYLSLFLYLLIRIIDCLDGAVARQCGKKSTFGSYLDIITDQIGLVVVICGFIFTVYPEWHSFKTLILVILIVGGFLALTLKNVEAHTFNNKLVSWGEQNSLVVTIIFWLVWVVMLFKSGQL